MTRRSALVLPVLLPAALMLGAALMRGDERSDVIELITPLAHALSEGDADAFMRRIPQEAPNRRRLSENIQGLVAQAEITSSVKVISLDGDQAELDWLMDIRSRATQSILERRKGKVVATLRDRRLFSLEPADFFKPAAVR